MHYSTVGIVYNRNINSIYDGRKMKTIYIGTVYKQYIKRIALMIYAIYECEWLNPLCACTKSFKRIWSSVQL